MLDAAPFNFRGRSAAIGAAFGVASALALAGVMVAPTVASAASTPVNTLMPSLVGSGVLGSTVTLTPGTFSNETSQDGTWEQCSTATSTTCTATTNRGSTYAVSSTDPVGGYIRLKEVAINASGSTTAWSNAVGPTSAGGPVSTEVPSLAGSGVQGSTVTLTPGTFSNETSQDGTWEQCPTATSTTCTATANRGNTYAVTATDPVGGYIRLKEVATNASASTTSWSNAVGPTSAAGPVNTLAPLLAGSAAQGSVIRLTPGVFSNETTQDGIWERCSSSTSTSTCTATSNTGDLYTVSASDPVGDYIRLKEIATNASATTTIWSNAIGPMTGVAPNPVNTHVPSLTGSASQGSVITLTPGTFTNDTTQDGTWERCPSATSTACTATANTGVTYTVTASDPVGYYIRLQETATNPNGSTTVWSNAIGPMTSSGPVQTLAPSLAGSAVQGSTISLTPGTFSNETSQDGTWEHCPTATSTSSCTATTNTGLTYVLSASDPVGGYIRLLEVATNPNGSTTAWSNAIGPVTAGSGSTGSAGYTGTCTKTISPPADPAATESGMSAGQTLCLNTGTYDSITEPEPNYFYASGKAGNPIVVTSGPGQVATILGSDWLEGAYVTFEYLNLNVSDTLSSHAATSAFSGCASIASDGIELDASGVVLQNNNIYESVYRDELIGVNYSDSSNPVTNDVITHNNLGPGGSCKQLDHLIYDDYSTGLQITQNWFFDDPYGYGVQLYVAPTNTTISGNVFDNVLDGVISASSSSGNTISHNVGINLPNVSGYNSGKLLACYQSGSATASNNAMFNAANGIGTTCGGLQITGTNPTLTANPFVGGANSDNYTLASNTAATTVAGYGLWNGQGPPSPNPALTFPQDPTNPGP